MFVPSGRVTSGAITPPAATRRSPAGTITVAVDNIAPVVDNIATPGR
jgi:hypothetical protein